MSILPSYAFAALLEQALTGDEVAWARLYRSCAPAVLGYMRARGAQDPEELLGETFLQVVRGIDRFRGDERDFRAWVMTIAHRRYVDDVRARTRRGEVINTVGESASKHVGNVEHEALEGLTNERIERLLAGLSSDQQAVLLLRIFGAMTVGEIARALGKRPGAVKQLQRRGVAAIKRQLLLDPVPNSDFEAIWE